MLNRKVSADDAVYYGLPRHALFPLISGKPKRILEIGCGNGATLALLKAAGAEYVCGIEINPVAAAEAQRRSGVDQIYVGDIETGFDHFVPGSFDLVVASHVLEHLVDPWTILKRIHNILASQGQLVGAIPNIRHLSVLVPLVFSGRWKYENSGILDCTHLRFFTRREILIMLSEAGFENIAMKNDFLGPKSKFINLVSAGILADLSAYAYNFSGTKA